MATRALEEAADQIEAILDDLARLGDTATYAEVGSRLDPPQRAWSSRITAALNLTVIEDVKAGRPLRAALVVGKRTQMPGPGFFEQARAMGREVPEMSAGRRAFAEAEQARVFRAAANN